MSRARRSALLLGTSLLLSAGGAAAQEPAVRVAATGDVLRIETVRDRGYAAVPVLSLERLGWTVSSQAGSWRLRLDSVEISLVEGSPFVRARGRLLQLADAPYRAGSSLHVPAQLLLDVLPALLPSRYEVTEGNLLNVLPQNAAARAEPPPSPSQGAPPSASPPPPSPRPQTSPPAPLPEARREVPSAQRRVVVIDPGHGGVDPGAMGAGGVREKDVALALGRALARELERHPELEVHLTRDSDVLVPLWQRGEWATRMKGERTGVFISLHANALPAQRAARGFETYFLSEARTDHERRVAANENAPLALEQTEGRGGGANPDLDGILRELRNLDHAHWSALLAELVQQRLEPVHPGPNRGVKQAPLAVITNALMPAVLVEVGFITHREEERLLTRGEFQADAARAVADAVLAFFQRYPPGRTTTIGGLR